jgi:hypothetical protein
LRGASPYQVVADARHQRELNISRIHEAYAYMHTLDLACHSIAFASMVSLIVMVSCVVLGIGQNQPQDQPQAQDQPQDQPQPQAARLTR